MIASCQALLRQTAASAVTSILAFWFALFCVPAVSAQEKVELVFHFGSEKKEWLKEVTDTFNAALHKDAMGRVIHVKLVPMGSKICVEPLLDNARASGPDLVSPASTVYVEWANGKWAKENSSQKPVIELLAKQLVRSPVVIAMWRDRAVKLGWPDKAIGWTDLFDLARKGWGSEPLKFAHTHPELSNSGLLALLAISQARTGNFEKLTARDLQSAKVQEFVEAIERSVIYYGESTGFLKDKMIERGPNAFHAVVLYENLVIAANQAYEKKAKEKKETIDLPKLVAIYPEEGTFMCDHPVGFVKRDWSAGKENAAKVYVEFLLAKEQQDLAIKTGFRPADGSKDAKLTEPFVRKYGADVHQPRHILKSPSADVVESALELWREKKKRADVVLLMDISGSMDTIDDPKGGPNDTRMARAKLGALKLADALEPQDSISLGTFHSTFKWRKKGFRLDSPLARAELADDIKSIQAFGQTALYSSVREGYKYLKERRALNPDAISMLVILSDGEDTRSQKELPKLMEELNAQDGIMLITMAYGKEANSEDSKNLRKVLRELANKTEGLFFEDVHAKDVEKFIQQIYELFGGREVAVRK